MAKKAEQGSEEVVSKPAFPYTNKPASLRKFLESVPKRPKPTKINVEYLKGLGFKDSNDQSIIRVLKALDLVSNSGNEPTAKFAAFMQHDSGPAVLGQEVKRIYAPLFEKSHQPHKESDETLRNYFNIHSGGSTNTLALQMQTFKALCDHSDFSSPGAEAKSLPTPGSAAEESPRPSGFVAPTVHIDLHIHLPENKTSRDYEYILQDIAKYIYGRDGSGRGERDG